MVAPILLSLISFFIGYEVRGRMDKKKESKKDKPLNS